MVSILFKLKTKILRLMNKKTLKAIKEVESGKVTRAKNTKDLFRELNDEPPKGKRIERELTILVEKDESGLYVGQLRTRKTAGAL